MTQAKNLTGQSFGLWSVKARAGSTSAGKAAWIAVCQCGTERTMSSDQLTSGRSKSCGCRRAVITRAVHTKHGKSKSLTYFVWSSMLQRTTNPDNKSYPRYGGKGIGVSEDWKSFENFFQDMGEAPPGFQIERSKNHLGYSKENCYWATPSQNMRNTSQNTYVSYQGREMTLIEASELSGVNYDLLRSRKNKGITGEDLFSKTRLPRTYKDKS